MQATGVLLPLILFTGMTIGGCDADNGGASLELTSEAATSMKINIKLPDRTLTATLYDHPTARDFAAMLPLTLMLDDYSATEKISDLPRKLATQGAPEGADPSIGDMAYYAPWGNLAVFYKDFGYSRGLILLGKLAGDVEALSVAGSLKVTIELQGTAP